MSQIITALYLGINNLKAANDALPDGAGGASDTLDWAKIDADRAANPDNLCLKYFTKEFYDGLSAEEKPQMVKVREAAGRPALLLCVSADSDWL